RRRLSTPCFPSPSSCSTPRQHPPRSTLFPYTTLFRSLGVYDSSAIVVVSDHGDQFYEHGSVGHGDTVYQELTHVPLIIRAPGLRSEEHTSELQSPCNLVCRLLLEKKNTTSEELNICST